ncbi:sigma-54-dependent Fis family transcriptional regulator [Donghicola sp. C2-DW-16]|uniref:Sigma-54-dependent Fis family transcriptional regulator n=1 Tax=Donghicola mangrovi TaxID=2729614 RepID=A0ABX2PDA8_9RHOB|nr:sigma-54 dependent transcriptional regulator [Donghicola mangrovi]NVO27447.1 sigma-54-dependent Fis family transcriptional regulator [Donghicola mangrovi]
MTPSTQPAAQPPAEGASQSHIDRAIRHVSILIVDDEPGMRNYLTRTLEPRCKKVMAAANAEEASTLLDAHHFDLVLLDNVMPGQSGLDWLAEQRRVGLFAEAILMTAYADLETAIHAMRVGASDFVLKPFRSNQILNAVNRCMVQKYLRRENFLLKYELQADSLAARGRLIGTSPGIESVRKTLERVAPMPTPVLFTGASGTGKEICARTLHAMSDRANAPFVPINCASISPDRLSRDLFGDPTQPGSDGLLVHASGGTIFLDEVAELPLPMQGELLRVLEDGSLRPHGSEREMPLNLRFVFATNADLDRAMEEGRFRRDLYHRINVVNIQMPPLRERVGDIPELAELFMGKFSRQLGVEPLVLTDQVLLNMARYDWQGNVRELKNLIERSLILGEFPPEFAGSADGGDNEPVESLHAVERRHILSVLEACGGNRAEAARRLGVSRKTIDRKCSMWNV